MITHQISAYGLNMTEKSFATNPGPVGTALVGDHSARHDLSRQVNPNLSCLFPCKAGQSEQGMVLQKMGMVQQHPKSA